MSLLRVSLLLIFAAGCGASGGAAEPALTGARDTAPKGAAVYDRECAGCHGAHGEGLGSAPAVMGAAALPPSGSDRGTFMTGQDVFDYVKSEMPLPKKKVGTLSDQQYWDVVGYLLAASGRKVPEGGLSPDNAASVQVNPGK
jgi:mono/diheme cytochrome c family protein